MSYIFFLFLFATTVSAQQGFLNIVCGGMKSFEVEMFGHDDKSKNMSYVTDSKYIHRGTNNSMQTSIDLTMQSLQFISTRLRYFPLPYIKSCYTLDISPNESHLLRLWFVPISVRKATFTYTIEGQDIVVRGLSPITDTTSRWDDWIIFTGGKSICVCLVRGEIGDPYISNIQLIKLGKGMYPQAKVGVALVTKSRFDVGCDSDSDYLRYPDDDYDRIWSAASIPEEYRESLAENISSEETNNNPPSIVMQTAYSISDPTNFSIKAEPERESLVFLYFSFLWNSSVSSDDLSFTITIDNSMSQNVTVKPNYQAVEVSLNSNCSSDDGLHYLYFGMPNVSVNSKETPPALLNAFEVFNILPSEERTDPEAVSILSNLKKELKFDSTSWILGSDPCFVMPWEHINCKEANVTGMNLSNMSLEGIFPAASINYLNDISVLNISYNKLQGPFPNFSNLSKLDTIDLRNNKFSGILPEWLFQQKELKNLYIQNNNFSGEIPLQLSKKFTKFEYTGNKFLEIHSNENESSVAHSTSSKWSGGLITGVTAITIVLVFLSLLLARHLLTQKQTLPPSLQRSYSDFSLPDIMKLRSFTMEEMKSATKSYSTELGRGGFGSVYYGMLQDGEEIAVKVLSHYAQQGKKEFLNELNLLSEVNHNKLVRLLGFCKAGNELMIVYEYMAGGSLAENIHGTKQQDNVLSWKCRLKIALDAAQGLEYLHMNCKPKIIHRDLKSANILLDGKLNGKLSDLGLSIGVMEDATHVCTQAKGTIGYLDPEYYTTNTLTEKSDVYSMGVVLLEIVCGRKPIDKNTPEISLIKYVTNRVDGEENMEKVSSLIDMRLTNKHFSIKSVETVIKLALRCVRQNSSDRPNANEIVLDLKAALEEEYQSRSNNSEDISIDCSSLTDMSSSSLFQTGMTGESSTKSSALFSSFVPR